MMLAVVLSVVASFAIENPIRHWKVLSRSGVRSICVGAFYVGVSLKVMAFELSNHP